MVCALAALLTTCKNPHYLEMTYRLTCHGGDAYSVRCQTLMIDSTIAKFEADLEKIKGGKEKIVKCHGEGKYNNVVEFFEKYISDLNERRPNFIQRWFFSDKRIVIDDMQSNITEGEYLINSFGNGICEAASDSSATPKNIEMSQSPASALSMADESSVIAISAVAPTSEASLPKLIETKSPDVFSPSFDCKMAKTPSEILICHDSELSKLDSELAKIFLQAKSTSTDPKEFKRQTIAAWKLREAIRIGDGGSPLVIDTFSTQDNIFGSKTVQIRVNLSVFDAQGRSVASKEFTVHGSSMTDHRMAHQAAIKELAEKLRETGLLVALGFNSTQP
jgi:hypothetical protein